MNKLIGYTLFVCALTACDSKLPVTKDAPAAPAPNLTQIPDVGKVEQVTVTASGTGPTPGSAVNSALASAVAQVNGVKVDATSATVSAFATVTGTLDVETSEGGGSAKAVATMQSQAFREQIVAQSKGLVSSFKVLKTSPPVAAKGVYTVEIEARIAKFKAPADAGKIKIVVAPLRSQRSTFDIGGRAVPASELLGSIHQQILDALSQTGRFSVLDRQFEGELQQELNLIGSGQAVNTDLTKLGQALSADLVWVGVVNDLAYTKHVRKLQTSDRELVSYSGGWSVSQRMINLATRQILQSNTLQGTPPAIEPTTLGTGYDATATVRDIQSEIVKKATESILLQSFPISVVERDGNNVVLSQGGKTVTQGGRYMLYLQGKELKDPQTGQSLGNMESPCCEVVISRITPAISYGVLENVKVDLKTVQPGALRLRESLAQNSAPVAPAALVESPTQKPSKPAKANPSASETPALEPEKKKTKKDEW